MFVLNNMIIYCITNNFGLPFYIGKDKYNKFDYYGSSKYLNTEIEYYGKENFKKIILYETNDYQELNQLERFYISFFRQFDDIDLYNISSGGGLGDVLTNHPNIENIRKKMSNSWNYEKHTTKRVKRLRSLRQSKNNCWNINKRKCIFCGIESTSVMISRWHNQHCLKNPNINIVNEKRRRRQTVAIRKAQSIRMLGLKRGKYKIQII